jgi:hypothetical protein
LSDLPYCAYLAKCKHDETYFEGQNCLYPGQIIATTSHSVAEAAREL